MDWSGVDLNDFSEPSPAPRKDSLPPDDVVHPEWSGDLSNETRQREQWKADFDKRQQQKAQATRDGAFDVLDEITALERHIGVDKAWEIHQQLEEQRGEQESLARTLQQLNSGQPANQAMAVALRDVLADVAYKQYQQQQHRGKANELDQVVLAREVVKEAIKQGRLGLLGQRMAIELAEKGQVPNEIKDLIPIVQNRTEAEKEKGFQKIAHKNRQAFLKDLLNSWQSENTTASTMPQQPTTDLSAQAPATREARFNRKAAELLSGSLTERQRVDDYPLQQVAGLPDSRLQHPAYRQWLDDVATELEETPQQPAPKNKTLLATISQLGGLRKDTLEDSLFESLKFGVNTGQLPGTYKDYYRVDAGMTLDDMATALYEEGFHKQGRELTVNELSEAIWNELSGQPMTADVKDVPNPRQQLNHNPDTAPAIRAALNNQPMNEGQKLEVAALLDDAEHDPAFKKPEHLSQDQANIERQRLESATTDSWYDVYELQAIEHLEDVTGLDVDEFNDADWQLIADAEQQRMLDEAAENERANQVEDNGRERETNNNTEAGPRLRYGPPRVGEEDGQKSQEAPKTEEDYQLSTQSEQELADREASNQAAEAEAARQRKDAEQKAQADKERDDFDLTGSNRPADIATAGGQSDLLGAGSNPQPTRREERQRRRKRKLIAIDDELSQAADELAEVFRSEAGKLGSGLDPVVAAKVLQHGMKVGVLLVQKGAVKFSDWADNVLAVMESKGIDERQVAPHLKSLYQAVSVSESLDESLADEMDSRKDVRAFDVEALLEPLESEENYSKNSQNIFNEPKETEFVQKLKGFGAEWQKDEQHRLYFEAEHIPEIAGFELQQTPNGMITGATLNGKKVSAGNARRINPSQGAKLWYDVNTDFYGHNDQLSEDVFNAAVERLEALRLATLEQGSGQTKTRPSNKSSRKQTIDRFTLEPYTEKSLVIKGSKPSDRDLFNAVRDRVTPEGAKKKIGTFNSRAGGWIFPESYRHKVAEALKAELDGDNGPSGGSAPSDKKPEPEAPKPKSKSEGGKDALDLTEKSYSRTHIINALQNGRQVITPESKYRVKKTDYGYVAEVVRGGIVREHGGDPRGGGYGFSEAMKKVISDIMGEQTQATESREDAGDVRGLYLEEGEHKGRKYSRVADVDKVAPSLALVARLVAAIKPGDLFIDKFGNKVIVDKVAGTNIHYTYADGDQGVIDSKQAVSKEDQGKLYLEVRRQKLEQQKNANKEELKGGNQAGQLLEIPVIASVLENGLEHQVTTDSREELKSISPDTGIIYQQGQSYKVYEAEGKATPRQSKEIESILFQHWKDTFNPGIRNQYSYSPDGKTLYQYDYSPHARGGQFILRKIVPEIKRERADTTTEDTRRKDWPTPPKLWRFDLPDLKPFAKELGLDLDFSNPLRYLESKIALFRVNTVTDLMKEFASREPGITFNDFIDEFFTGHGIERRYNPYFYNNRINFDELRRDAARVYKAVDYISERDVPRFLWNKAVGENTAPQQPKTEPASKPEKNTFNPDDPKWDSIPADTKRRKAFRNEISSQVEQLLKKNSLARWLVEQLETDGRKRITSNGAVY